MNRRYEEVLQTYNQNGEIINSYTYGVDRINSVGQDNETYLYDGRGSVVGSVENDILTSYSYTAYGDLMPQSPQPKVFGFNGEATDFETGMQYLRARYYNVEIGRFMQKDIYRGTSTNPKSMHRYMYVYNNPVNYIDKSGFRPVEVATVNTHTYKQENKTTKDDLENEEKEKRKRQLENEQADDLRKIQGMKEDGIRKSGNGQGNGGIAPTPSDNQSLYSCGVNNEDENLAGSEGVPWYLSILLAYWIGKGLSSAYDYAIDKIAEKILNNNDTPLIERQDYDYIEIEREGLLYNVDKIISEGTSITDAVNGIYGTMNKGTRICSVANAIGQSSYIILELNDLEVAALSGQANLTANLYNIGLEQYNIERNLERKEIIIIYPMRATIINDDFEEAAKYFYSDEFLNRGDYYTDIDVDSVKGKYWEDISSEQQLQLIEFMKLSANADIYEVNEIYGFAGETAQSIGYALYYPPFTELLD